MPRVRRFRVPAGSGGYARNRHRRLIGPAVCPGLFAKNAAKPAWQYG